jgi:hypothetical protein
MVQMFVNLNLGMGFKKWMFVDRRMLFINNVEHLNSKSNDFNANQIHYADDRDVHQPQP